jgi:hypothetical protein
LNEEENSKASGSVKKAAPPAPAPAPPAPAVGDTT